MKLKKIVDMCRREGIARIYKDEKDIQWLSCGSAMYPLYEVPELGENEFYTIFDITQKQRDDIVFEIAELPETYNTADNIPREVPCEELSPHIPFGSRLLIPYKTARGIKFLDSEYLAPFSDEGRELEVYERVTDKGERYFAVKIGLLLRAIIMPFNAINRNFVENIENIYWLCKEALEEEETSGK